MSLGQTLNVPPRPSGAPDGTQFTNIITSLSRDERENWIYAQVISGNVPGWLRALKPINVSAGGHTGTYHVIPDYLAIGSDTDYFLEPTTPMLAQRLGDRLGCTLPTRKMVNQIWANAAFKMNPVPIPPSAEMITVPVFAQHNAMVQTQRNSFTNAFPLGALVGGNKKDVVISNEITNRPPPPRVVIYGWHYPDGSFIQPLSAIHEATYADYSHGLRLVQMNMTVDGSANTVANVLASASLNSLLSDEGAIPLPRYTVAPLAPVVMTPPRSRTVLAGQTVTFGVLAIGDMPLAYRWQLFGTNLPNATNTTLVITNALPADAGNYSVVVSNAAGSATSRLAVLRVNIIARPIFFADDFETNTSTNWNVFWGAANGVPDYTVDWAFDYGVIPYTFNGVTHLIPPAPNSPDGSTRGVKFTVNNNDVTGSTAAVNVYPRNLSVTGNFALKFDLWINYPGNAGGINSTGSTQHAIGGINHFGTNVNWAASSATASDGLWFGVSGEGGDSRDYRAYVGNPNGTQIELTTSDTSGLAATNHTAAIFQSLFPAPRFETTGAPGKNWVEVELRQTNNFIIWLLDGTVVAQRTNASVFTSGNIMLGFMDTFSSIANPARDAFVLLDNVRVENLSPPAGFASVTRLPDGNVSLVLTNAPGDTYWLEGATNFVVWQPLASVLATSNTFTFVDTNTSHHPLRFYRTRR